MIFVADQYRMALAEIASRPGMIFDDLEIKVWRKLNDRENCTWDIPGQNRLHVKRFPAARGESHAKMEAEGYRLLGEREIPAAHVAAWGELDDGRSFIATEDLSGFSPADKLIESGVPFENLLVPTADLAARLHNAGLHHRDLYLCHFLARSEGAIPDIRLIDAARIGILPGALTRRRWIVKDISQFWYSMITSGISESQRDEWLSEYCRKTNMAFAEATKKAIAFKAMLIARHDKRLRRKQPLRNISIPR